MKRHRYRATASNQRTVARRYRCAAVPNSWAGAAALAILAGVTRAIAAWLLDFISIGHGTP